MSWEVAQGIAQREFTFSGAKGLATWRGMADAGLFGGEFGQCVGDTGGDLFSEGIGHVERSLDFEDEQPDHGGDGQRRSTALA